MIQREREREAALLGANASTYVNITSSENSGKVGPDLHFTACYF